MPWLRIIVLFAVAALTAVTARAQCALQRQLGLALPGTDGIVRDVTEWDPDGAGPLPRRVVFGGTFSWAGDVLANNIACFDPSTSSWSALGAGLNGSVTALAVVGNELIAGGSFSVSAGSAGRNIARWDGASWQPLGGGSDGPVEAMVTLPNGDLIIGGSFAAPGGAVSAVGVARWDGSTWSALGSGQSFSGAVGVLALAVLPNGNVVAAGAFNGGILSWDGASWQSVGGGVVGQAKAVAVLQNGDLVVGGILVSAGGVPVQNVARWNGTAWSNLGGGIAGGPPPFPVVDTLAVFYNGDLLVGGSFGSAGGVPVGPVARWDGQAWTSFGGGFNAASSAPRVSCIAVTSLGVFAGGEFRAASGRGAQGIAAWNGSGWQPLAPGADSISIMATDARSGDVYVGGQFAEIDGVACACIARWNGSVWTPLGSGLAFGNGRSAAVHSIAVADNGDVFVGGAFDLAGGVPAVALAKWDGTGWAALGGGLSISAPFVTTVSRLLVLDNDDLLVSGLFSQAGGVAVSGLARWDGTAWSPFGNNQSFFAVAALAQLANGDVAAAVPFASVGAVRRWNGAAWLPLGGGMALNGSAPDVGPLLTLANGDLIAAGNFDTADGLPARNIARWDGASWQAMGAGLPGRVRALLQLPNGDLVAGGVESASSPSSSPSTGLWRWNGSSWQQLGDGLVHDLAFSPSGELFAAGRWRVIPSAPTWALASIATSCPATVTQAGGGCSGSGGANVLRATAAPWIGATFESQANGMPATGLALRVAGLGTVSTPLATILPQGLPGCNLLVTVDLLDVFVPAAGTVTTSLAIPNTLSLAGQVFHQQVVPLELDAAGNIVALTSTNRLTLTIGSF